MIYYEDKDGQIIGRLYKAGSGWAAEIGRRAEKNSFGFIAVKGIKCKTFRQAESYLLSNGCVAVAAS